MNAGAITAVRLLGAPNARAGASLTPFGATRSLLLRPAAVPLGSLHSSPAPCPSRVGRIGGGRLPQHPCRADLCRRARRHELDEGSRSSTAEARSMKGRLCADLGAASSTKRRDTSCSGSVLSGCTRKCLRARRAECRVVACWPRPSR